MTDLSATPSLAPLIGRACDTTGCPEIITAESDPSEWQVLDEVGLVLCDDHRVCETCYGDGYTVRGDQEEPCPECADWGAEIWRESS